jgi:Rrf2 family protein
MFLFNKAKAVSNVIKVFVSCTNLWLVTTPPYACAQAARIIWEIYIMSIGIVMLYTVRAVYGSFIPYYFRVHSLPMKLSLRGEYALRALLVLGLKYDESVVRIQTISEDQTIPKRFLEQILNDLKSAGVVQSRRGVAGGYRLARRPEEITLAVVVRHIEGALAPVSCVSERFYEKCSCPDESRCAIRSVMKEIREAVVRIAERVTVAELCDRWRRLQQEPLKEIDFII